MRENIIQILQNFEEDLARQKFTGNALYPSIYEVYADKILTKIENHNEKLKKKADEYYRSDWINMTKDN